jgi:phosphatidate phosphatase APP1
MRIQDLREKARQPYNPHAKRPQQAQTQRANAYVAPDVDHQEVTAADVRELENMIDQLFHKVGIDVALSQTHFVQRMNDMRGPVTTKEVGDLFRKAFAKYGKLLAKSGPEMEAVLTDIQSAVNVPFNLYWNRDKEMLDLSAKTVMKKKGFRTRNKMLRV